MSMSVYAKGLLEKARREIETNYKETGFRETNFERYKREEGVMSGGGRRIAGTFVCMRRSGSDGSGYFRKNVS